jgi:hypothetical protein
MKRWYEVYPLAYQDGTDCSETLAFKLQTKVNHPEESIHSEQGEILKSRKIDMFSMRPLH